MGNPALGLFCSREIKYQATPCANNCGIRRSYIPIPAGSKMSSLRSDCSRRGHPGARNSPAGSGGGGGGAGWGGAKVWGGGGRRVDVALSIIGRPELLFLDEPTTGFDPEARQEFWQLIRDLKDEGTTILLTTHYLDEAAQLGDRAAIILDGRIIDAGKITELGGPEARTPVVRWIDPDGVEREQRTLQPAALVASLVAEGGGAEPNRLEVIQPSLEDIYLALVRQTKGDLNDNA